MRRLVLALGGVLALMIGFAAPAQATVPPHPYDILITRVTSTSETSAFWRAGNIGIDACELWIKSKRTEDHSVRVEVVRRDINAVIYSVVKTAKPGISTLWDFSLAYEGYSTELYARWRWGDDAPPYSYATLDPFDPFSQMSFKPVGTWGPSC